MMAHFRRRRNSRNGIQSVDSMNVQDPDVGEANDLEPPLLNNSNWSVDTTLFQRMWSMLGGSATAAPTPVISTALNEELIEAMELTRSIAISLGLPSKLPEPFHTRLPFLRSDSSDLRLLIDDLELLTFYTKLDAFLTAICSSQLVPDLLRHLTHKLEECFVHVLSADSRLSPEALTDFSSDFDLLFKCLDGPGYPVSPTVMPSALPKDQYLKFSYCQFQFASFLSNLSTKSECASALGMACLRRWLHLWSASEDIRLQLHAEKIHHNLLAHVVCESLATKGDRVATSITKSYSPKQREHPVFYISEDKNESSAVNLEAERFCEAPSSRLVDDPVIFGPDIFKLDQRDINSPPAKVDVIFINGMLGSVFHTWRQHDLADNDTGLPEPPSSDVSPSSLGWSSSSVNEASRINCWPRAWLSKEFPEARILGVNANLKPFVWNPICPADRLNRRIDQRARDILQQLVSAGVGRRPIIWISHSAGGILTKEVLRLAATNFAERPQALSEAFYEEHLPRPGSCIQNIRRRNGQSNHYDGGSVPTLSPEERRQSASMPMLYEVAIEPTSPIHVPFSSTSSASFADDLDSSMSSCAFVSLASEIPPSQSTQNYDICSPVEVANQTRGIVFLSTPHRGNQSLMFLYQFPMFFALTPEAKQLQQNSASIMSLHTWFIPWASSKGLRIMNMVETQETAINRWYSVCLVPYDPVDDEFSDVVLVNADHASICKPRNRQDEVYVKIVDFIRDYL